MSGGLPMLTFDTDRTVLADGQRGDVSLSVSPHTLAARHWPQGWPTPFQLERAIDDVESAIEQTKLRHADRGALWATTSVQTLMPGLLTPHAVTSRDAVEVAFSRLAAAAHTPARHAGADVLDGEGAAALLILREVMHHLGFQVLVATGAVPVA